jgi:carbamoylphosphate synthase large subunit
VSAPRPTLLAISCYFKGNAFLERAKREGCKVMLLTTESTTAEPWAKHALDEFFVTPTFENRRALINTVAYLHRERRIDRIVALDDYDVEVGAYLREHFRIPGLGDSLARLFRDKLAMRVKATELGLPCPAFTALFEHAKVGEFLARVPGPYLIKPRFEASAVGIRKVHNAEEAWAVIHSLGDEQSFHLMERMIDGEMFHVDSLVAEGKVAFAEASKYHKPLLEVAQGGGIYATRMLSRQSAQAQRLCEANRAVLEGFGLRRGASHTEFIVGREDGQPYFIETSARVGGAYIAEMVEAATGVNLWSEWAALEIAGEGVPYTPPVAHREYAGAIISLARQEWPDTSAFDDPEIVHRVDKKHHVGFVVRSPDADRVEKLLSDYMARIATDHHAALPPANRATA